MSVYSDLKRILGSDLILEKEQMVPYETDASPFSGEEPLAIALPHSVEQVSELLKYSQKNSIPVVARGGGTSLTGASVPLKGSIVVSMARFNRIHQVEIADRYVIAEPGVRVDDLNSRLSVLGHFYPPDPASSIAATVGGTISTNAGGLRASMYGTTKNWILGLEVVLPDGTVINTGGKVLKRTLGYDLTSLFVGAEGTLGIVTKAILKIWPLPEKTGRILSYYDSIENVGIAVSSMKGRGVTPLIAEFLDRITMDSISESGGLTFPEKAKFMLMIDIASTTESIERELSRAESILKESKPLEIRVTTDRAEMDSMYEARKGAYSSLLNNRKTPSERVVIGDVVVPASRLPEALKESEEAAEKLGIRAALFGHIADGNIHANIYTNIEDESVREKVEEYQKKLAGIALKHSGSVSAEHGVGLEKKELLLMELDAYGSQQILDLMRGIRKVFDPNGIMNRGKLFD